MKKIKSPLLRELDRARTNWLKAKEKGDTVGMSLWLRIGRSARRRIDERMKGKNGS